MPAFHVPFFAACNWLKKKKPSGCPRAAATVFSGKDVKSFIQMAFCSYRTRCRTPRSGLTSSFSKVMEAGTCREELLGMTPD